MPTSNPAVVILAAGQGKRMKRPDLPKVLHTLAGEPLIDHVVRLARSVDPCRIIVIVGHGRDQLTAHLRSLHPDVETAVQAEQLGTAHAVLQAQPLLDGFEGDIAILSGDAPLLRRETFARMFHVHRAENADVTVLTAVLPDPSGYGRVIRADDGSIRRIVEDKDATEEERRVREINSGMYIFRARPLFDALKRVRNDNAQGEYYLPDVFEIFAGEGLRMIPFPAPSFDETRGVNTPEQLQEMERLYVRLHGGSHAALSREG